MNKEIVISHSLVNIIGLPVAFLALFRVIMISLLLLRFYMIRVSIALPCVHILQDASHHHYRTSCFQDQATESRHEHCIVADNMHKHISC